MKLFYDTASKPLLAEAALLAADSAALASVVFFASEALRSETDPGTAALTALWCFFPRAIARSVAYLGAPGRFSRTFLGAAVLVGAVAALSVAGWDLLLDLSPRERGLSPGELASIFTAWLAGLWLFNPRAYRLYDLLLFSAILSALGTSRPFLWFWLPVFFLLYFFSAALRHSLYDAREPRARALPNLQNARVLALFAAAATTVVFGAAHGIVSGIRDTKPRRAARLPTSPAQLEPQRGESDSAGASRAHDVSSLAAENLESSLVCRVELKKLALARRDSQEVLRVSCDGWDSWKPDPGMLWKAASLSRFDPVAESWEEETPLRGGLWPKGGSLSLEPESPDSGTRISLRHRIVSPIFRSLLHPYGALAIESPCFSSFALSQEGDVFPSPRPRAGHHYIVFLELQARRKKSPSSGGPPAGDPDNLERLRFPGPLSEAGLLLRAVEKHPDPRYSEVPSPGDLGLDLGALAGAVFARSPPRLADKIAALRSYYAREGFRYSEDRSWAPGAKALRRFLLDEKRGDCSHYATATALLLRAGGMSARIAVGLAGASWDPQDREAVFRNSGAHSWVEIYVPGNGWHPLDPTDWVPAEEPLAAEAQPHVARAAYKDTADGDGSREAAAALEPVPGRGLLAEPERPLEEISEEPLAEPTFAEFEEPADDSAAPEWISYETVRQIPPAPALAAAEIASEGAPGKPPANATVWPLRPRSALPSALKTALRCSLLPLALAVLCVLIRALRKPASDGQSQQASDAEEAGGACGAEFEKRMRALARDLEPRARIIAEYLALQRLLERTRKQRQPSETPLEHARRVAGRRRDLQRAFETLNQTLYDVVYGGAAPTERDALAVARSCRKIARVLA